MQTCVSLTFVGEEWHQHRMKAWKKEGETKTDVDAPLSILLIIIHTLYLSTLL